MGRGSGEGGRSWVAKEGRRTRILQSFSFSFFHSPLPPNPPFFILLLLLFLYYSFFSYFFLSSFFHSSLLIVTLFLLVSSINTHTESVRER